MCILLYSVECTVRTQRLCLQEPTAARMTKLAALPMVAAFGLPAQSRKESEKHRYSPKGNAF